MEALGFSSRGDGTRLSGWMMPAEADRAVILVHGTDSDAWSGAAPDLARAYRSAGFSVLLFDLRAHGRSGGLRITLGRREREDIGAAVDLLLHKGIPPGRIALHGTSYGAAMAILAAAEIDQIGAVIADSAYADFRDVIAGEVGHRTLVPRFLAQWILRPGIQAAGWMLHDIDMARLAPQRAITRLENRPVLLIHGSQDPVIPPDHARRLKDHASGNVQLWMLEGKGHTEGARAGPCNRVPSPGRDMFLARVVSFTRAALSDRDRRGGVPHSPGPIR
jgi:pimeloyl-ACP methyl ester carboxylesterase